MSNWSLKSDLLTNIATVTRARVDMIYPAGTIYVQVSACKKNTDKIWNLLNQPGRLEGKYAIVEPLIEIVPQYFVFALERVTAQWHARYIGTNINISMDLFKYLKVDYHPDVRQQMEVLANLDPVESAIKDLEAKIALEREAKRWFLSKMLL